MGSAHAAMESLRLAAYGILFLPLLSFLINGLWLGRKSRAASGWLATVFMGATLVLAVFLALGYHAGVLAHPEAYPSRAAVAWEHAWMAFPTGSVSIPAARAGFHMDPISMMMVLVIAFISFLVNAYSIAYMRDDAASGRFFPLLSLFSFAMLGLVVSGNIIQTFFFWELVGAASYLLIGFWYSKPSAVAAAKKAFILTRLADAFFLIGLLVVGIQAGGFDFAHLNHPDTAAALDRTVGTGLLAFNLLSVGTLLIFMGAWGKSAMFPFHVWLPDAMEGPTPVSSLIHSATMVVAGVFLTARLFPLLAAADGTLWVVESAGAFTALFAAVIACAQTDLKRILAFSTLSQLGLMMMALGAGIPEGGGGSVSASGGASAAYAGSMFHIFTHAFFKCLLFLSAGVVIHAIHSNDIRKAGGLRKILPRTYWATLIAALALAGIWPLSGFFSKEEILHAALSNGHYGALAAGLATGGLTAFYMSRYFFLVFHGESRGGKPAAAAREGFLMTVPLLILALPSAFAGWLGRGFFREHVLPWPAMGAQAAGGAMSAAGHDSAGADAWLPFAAGLLALAGAGLGWYWYGLGKRAAGFPGRTAPLWYRVIADRFHIDEAWLFLAKRVGGSWIAAPAAWIEIRIVNGAFDRASGFLRRLAFAQSIFQSGQVQWYMTVALLGLLLLFRLGGF